MAVKWSYPGIGFSEIDNSIQANTTVADGVGAIVLNANRGYVNQRILSTSVRKFHENFGDPETDHDYGHFAADQYLAASPALYAVRATMGDEQYAFIQYPYSDAAAGDCKVDQLVQKFEYVDNEGNTQIKILDPMNGHVEFVSLSGQGWQTFKSPETAEELTESNYTNTAFCLVDDGYAVYYRDLQTDQDPAIRIIRDDVDESNLSEGKYYNVQTKDGDARKVFIDSSVTGSKTYVSAISAEGDAQDLTGAYLLVDLNDVDKDGNCPAQLHVPTYMTLTDDDANAYFYVASADAEAYLNNDSLTVDTILTDAETTISGTIAESADVYKVQFFDWNDEQAMRQEIIEQSAFKAKSPVLGSQFREITGALYNQQLVMSKPNPSITADIYIDALGKTLGDLSATDSDGSKYAHYSKLADVGYSAFNITNLDAEDAKKLAFSYGKELNDVYTSAYGVFEALDPVTNTINTRIIFKNNPNDTDKTEDGVYISPYIFNTYWDNDISTTGAMVVKAAYISRHPAHIYQPWVYNDNKESVKPLMAFSTTDIVNDPTGLYKDGYTKTILTVDEPGNGDIERYDSLQKNQLVIGAIAPGEFGNDIGISIITPEVADNLALTDQPAAFNWKYLFDDEDLVDKDWMENPNLKNPSNLTWKKVYKINVYVKSKTQQASVWGSGLDALVREPVESFLVSNDPTVKDGMGNSMYAPYVINGQSKYIYVSLNSVVSSRTIDGKYAMPKQTYSIYQLTGGKNSTKNEIKEKTAALELYRDRQKCMFDILFNVEAIETFQSRQKYAAMQNRIANIVADRGIDIGFIQVTSKAARTGYKALSEGKLFTFQNGSYVAAQAGYDRYYDQYTSNWIYLPKSIALAVAHARCWRAGIPWQAPAGVTYGTIDYSNGQLLKLSDIEIGQLYDAHINCSRTCAGYGEIIYGNKTMLKKTSALNRINVRGLINYIEKYLENMLTPFLFKPNTSTTRSNMLTTVDSFLSGIMASQGIIAKSVTVKPDPTDSHLVYVNISVIPAESLEFIQVTTTVNSQNSTITTSDNL